MAANGRKRPVGVTIIGWFIIVTSVFTVQSAFGTYSNVKDLEQRVGGTLWAQLVIFLTGFVSAICGIFILKGKAWAKLAYLVLSAILWVFSIAMFGLSSSLVGLICYLIILIYPTRPTASRFLGQGKVTVT